MMKYAILFISWLTAMSVAIPSTDVTQYEYYGEKLPNITVTAPKYIFNAPVQLDRSVEASIKHYNDWFRYIADNTPWSKEFIAGYFNLETGNGTSRLWLKKLNPSGIVSHKYNKHQSGTTYSSDDGGSIKAVFDNMQKAADGWVWVFNGKRYKRCRNKTVEETCKCFYEQGYHTSPRWKSRVTAVYAAKAAFNNL